MIIFQKRYAKEKMVDETHFKSLVGNLLYLTTTRLEMMFAIILLSRFMHSPSHVHLRTTKIVMGYLQGTLKLGTIYFRNIEMKFNISYYDSC